MSNASRQGALDSALVVCAVTALALLSACGKRGAKRIPRSKDAAPVVVVEQSRSGVTFAEEKEPNNTAEDRGEIAVPGGIRGNLDGETDVDVYRFEVASAGVLTAQLGGVEGVDLVLELRDGEGATLARSDRGPALTVEGLPNFPVAKGGYQLVVSEFVKKAKKRKRGKKKAKEAPAGRTGPSPDYELVAVLAEKAAEGHEVEPNETVEQARELLIGDEAFGFVGWNKDQDVWALPVAGFSPQYALEIEVSPVLGVWMTIEILDGEGTLIAKRVAGRGEPLRVRNLVPAEGAERYFARLSARRTNPEEKYSLRSSRRLLELDEEIEPNDAPATAMALSEDPKEAEGSRRGFLMPGDTDCYRLPARSEPFLFTVSVEPPSSVDAVLEVSTDAGAALGVSDRGKLGASESLSAIPVPAGASVVVKVAGKGDAEATNYDLRWSSAPGADAPAPDPTVDGYEDEP